MRKRFNQLKQEHGESGAGQCKWPWFERCLMIWGKTAKACGTAGGMDNGVPIDSVAGSAQEPVNLEDTENMMFLLLQTYRLLNLQATLLKSVRPHPHRGQQLARSQGWTVSLHKNLFLKNCVEGFLFLRNCVEGRESKLDGAAKMAGRLCVYVRILSACLPAFVPANFKEQAGRSQGFYNHVRDPRDGSRSCFDAGLLALPQ